ncbi:DUF956 family protein [Olsenella uli]|uniref:DUF956 family protein n=1 Tax=Olsenella uli TaxID=133926 RepID=UPI0012AC3EE0|nr:DUF956 family protein [Olsenella uli]
MAFNEVIEERVSCNCLTNGVMPKPGALLCGDAGIEFETRDGVRQLRVAWDEITSVEADIFRGDIRELAVHTDSGQILTLIPEDGAALVKAMGAHLDREVFTSPNEEAATGPSPLQKLRDRLRRAAGK